MIDDRDQIVRVIVLYGPMTIGIPLMAHPYFVPRTLLLYTVGGGLCLLLFVFRD